MSEIWFTGCTHFGHANIIKYCNRPFDNVKEMDECLLENIHDRVGSKDDFYILGDFAFGNFERVKHYVGLLPTKRVFLIRGNHDRISTNQYQKCGFSWVREYYELKTTLHNGNRMKITLFHYPMESWNGSFRGSWHLHSHTHNSMPDNPRRLRMNVGVDVTDFKPVNLEDVQSFMDNKQPLFDCQGVIK